MMTTVSRTSLLLLLLALAVNAGPYAGEKVIIADIESQEILRTIDSWNLDVWSQDSVLAIGPNSIRVSADNIALLESLGVSYTVLIDDLDAHMERFEKDLIESRASDDALVDFFVAYHTLAEITSFVQNISNVYSTITKFVPSVGTSIQGNNIFGLIVTGTATGNKKKIFISGGQHAREWVAPATVLYVINNLVTLYSTDATVKSLLDSTIIHFVPLVNPDGYLYTWVNTNNRLWRKNRRLNTGGTYGVDLNRNWNDHWGGEGSSGTPSSDTYRGTAPFSEPESKAVSDYVTANGPFNGAIDYHSYSQLILRPYGWTNQPPPNDALLKTVGDTIRARILAVNSVSYTSEPAWQLYYASGTADDWYYSIAKIPLAYTIELRPDPNSPYGFQLPANQIKPTGAENWAAFLYFVQAVISNTAN